MGLWFFVLCSLSVVRGQLSVVSRQWSVVSGQSSVVEQLVTTDN